MGQLWMKTLRATVALLSPASRPGFCVFKAFCHHLWERELSCPLFPSSLETRSGMGVSPFFAGR